MCFVGDGEKDWGVMKQRERKMKKDREREREKGDEAKGGEAKRSREEIQMTGKEAEVEMLLQNQSGGKQTQKKCVFRTMTSFLN